MTEQQKLEEICGFIRQQDMSLQIHQKPKRKDPMPNGWYQCNSIRVYTKDRIKYASETASLILHEYGHHVAMKTIGPDHTETDAWNLAASVVPENLKPKTFEAVRSYCLSSYINAGLL